MATFKCATCGHEKETRCKPRTCPKCEGKKTFEKKKG
ncbi:MAG: rubredoxin [Thermodesulfobacteriota bacterium]|nr:rubredoxin [Thermodesulfobacteriota bacterium]